MTAPSEPVPKASPLRPVLGPRDVRRIAASCNKDPRTVTAAYAGLAGDETSQVVAEHAVAQGYEPPPARRR